MSRPQRTGPSGAVSAERAPGCLSSGRVQSAVRLMARPEAEAEIHPLKAREAPASPGSGVRDAEKEAGGGAQPGRLSQWRTAAFFLSLYLCLGVAFAFSFVIPCPVRPASRTAWSRAYDDAGEGGWAAGALGAERGPGSPTTLSHLQWRTLSWARGTPTGTECKTCSWPSRPAPAAGTPGPPTRALAPEEVRRGDGGESDGFDGRGWCDRSAPPSSAGFASPCAFMAAHSGTNGSTLWERPVAQELLLMDCSVEHGGSPACLIIGNPASFALLDLETGTFLLS